MEIGRVWRKVNERERLDDPIGGAWLVRSYGIDLVQPLRVRCGIAPTRSSVHQNDLETRHYQEAARPALRLADHLEFMLKHELVHLEMFSRLFEKISGKEIAEWARARPTSMYARRAGFFYEWLTGETLDFSGVTNGGYVEALDPKRYLVGSRRDVPRWRVRANLLGTRAFCPLVVRTGGADAADRMSIPERWAEIEREFGEDALRRSAVWITLKESRSSFAIEHEGDERDRIKRFAAVIETQTGHFVHPVSEKALESIQRAIVGENSLTYGIRRSPVFVGESGPDENVVRYVAPKWEDVPPMLRGLGQVLSGSDARGTAVRAALLSFGLVYIHPFADGNGRTSRFLINDVLRRDGAIPAPFVLPVSAAMLREMREYDAALERFSRPFMARYGKDCRFGGPTIRYEDGLTSNFHFQAYEDARHAWRYPDLTGHVEYTTRLIERTLDIEMRNEARVLAALRAARERIKNVLEGPDPIIDHIIRSVRETGGTISNKLRGEFPILENPEVAQAIAEAVQSAFEEATAPSPSSPS